MDINQMVDDIYEQDQPKKPVNDLRDIGKYNTELSKSKQNDAESMFDSIYRTPQNASINLLQPSEFSIATGNEDTFKGRPNKFGNYDTEFGKTTIRDQEYVKKMVTPEQSPFFTQERLLVHENTHGLQDQLKKNFVIPRVTSEYNYFKEMDISGKQTGLKNEIRQFKEMLKKENIPLLTQEKSTEYLLKTPDEFPALYSQIYPDRIINPKSSLDRKLNRMWFQ